jgi:autotransporter-associated beta strand protein
MMNFNIKYALVLSLLGASTPLWAACEVQSDTSILATAENDSCSNTSVISTTGDGAHGMNDGASANVTLINNRTITTAGDAAAGIMSYGANVTIENHGAISTSGTGFSDGIDVYGNNARVTNTGSITVSQYNQLGVWFEYYTTGGYFNNSGTISTTGTQSYGVGLGASTDAFINSGTISASGARIISEYAQAVVFADGIINSFTNSGTIQSLNEDVVYDEYAVMAGCTLLCNNSTNYSTNGVITTFTNTGVIKSAAGNAGLYSRGTITTLNNAQGGDGLTAAKTALTYKGNLPTNYNIIVNSQSYYGQLFGSNLVGASTFGIYAGSTLAVGTYTSVLSGFDATNLTGLTAGNYNGYHWYLSNSNSSSGIWDLLVSTLPVTILSYSVTPSSALAGISPVLNSGTLQLAGDDTIANSITITSAGGTIDQNGFASIFSGTIADLSSEQPGKLTIANGGAAGSGSITLSGNNTYSGGTEVQAGANLSISSASNIGTGTLALVGSSTVPAILTTTADMTITNTIKVSGDPEFNVASDTTTTISGQINDGAPAGDVVVTGGGTLALTNVNTYTGPTTINSGSTLALSEDGSIATSSGRHL